MKELKCLKAPFALILLVGNWLVVREFKNALPYYQHLQGPSYAICVSNNPGFSQS
jgi:hypothetical protein